MNKFRYDAFISYRHVQPDNNWAIWLQDALENYRVPKKLVRAHKITPRINRIFRDETEMSASYELGKEIKEALHQSRFLIVVCSPRTPSSQWINEEIRYFQALGRQDKILTLLIEGEPNESFPSDLFKVHEKKTGNREKIYGAEPYAADVRPSPYYKKSQLNRMAKLKIIASLLGVHYDDLRQREQERKTLRLVYLTAFLTALTFLLSGLSYFAFSQRNKAQSMQFSANLNLANSQIAVGDLNLSDNRIPEARSSYLEAWTTLEMIGASTLPAEIAFWEAEQIAAPPSLIFSGHNQSVTSVAISRNGRSAAIGSYGLIQIVDITTGKEMRRFRGHSDYVYDLNFSPVKDDILLSCGDNVLKLWDIKGGREIHSFTGHKHKVKSADISPNGEIIASGSLDHKIKIWNVNTGNELLTLNGHSGEVNCVNFSPDGQYLLSGSSDYKVKFWDVSRGELICTFNGHKNFVNAVVFSPDAQKALSGSSDKSIKLWDLESGKLLNTFNLHNDAVWDVCFTSSGNFVLSTSADHFLKLWDISDGFEIRAFAGSSGIIDPTSLALSPDNRRALTAHSQGAYLWDLGLETGKIEVHEEEFFNCVALSPNGEFAASGSEDCTIKLWDISDAYCLSVLKGHQAAVTCLAFPQDGQTILSGSDDGTVKLWDILDGKILNLAKHTGGVACLDYSPGSRFVVSGGKDCILRFSDVQNGKEEFSIKTQEKEGITGVTITHDGKKVVSVGDEGMLTLWDVKKRKIISRWAGHNGKINHISFYPDEKFVATTSGDGLIKIWHIANCKEYRTFQSNPSCIVKSLAFSSDGHYMLAQGPDLSVALWDVLNGRILRSINVDDIIVDLVLSPNEKNALVATFSFLIFYDFAHSAKRWSLLQRLGKARSEMAEEKNMTEAMTAFGEWYSFLGLYYDAIYYLEKARELDGKISSLLLAKMYRRVGNKKKALIEFQRALNDVDASSIYIQLCIRSLNKGTIPD